MLASPTMPMTFPRDRLAWLWLVLGTALLSFVAIQTELPFAAWFAPVFLLRFARTQRALVGMPLVTLGCVAAMLVANRNLAPMPLLGVIGVLFGLIYALPYLIDRLLAPRLGGLARTLVFPAALTASGLLVAILTPFGSSASPAYSQYGLLPLVQIVSLTGIWGLNFLVAWFGPVANAFWEREHDATTARRSLVLFAGVLAAALLFGSARLAFLPTAGPTVRVAALAPDERLPFNFPVITLAGAPDQQRAIARSQAAAKQDELFERTVREARAGAELVSWSEAGAFVLKEDEAALIERAGAVARAEGIYLQLGLVVILRAEQHPYGENRAILLDPHGAVVWDYAKTFHPMTDGEVFATGPGTVSVADTALGRLAAVICYDMDFPALLRQVGRARTGLLLAPSSDWGPVKYSHAQWSTFRAIENGVSLVRPTRQGLQIAVDHQGRVLGSADSLDTNRSTMVVTVPTQGVWTLYSVIGDAFGYLSLAVLVSLAGLAFGQRRTARVVIGAPAVAAR